MFKFSGNPRQLAKFHAKLEASGDLLPIISAQLAEEAFNQAQEGFKQGENPYGEKWDGRMNTTRRNRGKAILVDTGLMRRSMHVAIKAKEFSLRFARPYAHWHQSGTGKMVQRMLVPITSRGLPPSWAREFELVIEDVFDVLFG